MSFIWPAALAALVLIPLAVAGYLLAQRRRRQYAVRFTNLDLLGSVVSSSPGWRRHLPAALFLVALGLLVIALARPQRTVATPRQEGTVMLTFDVSGSMQATDVEPSRLAAAQRAGLDFLRRLPGPYRLGLVTFSSAPALIVEPTTDRDPVKSALSALEAGGGTAMGEAIAQSIAVLEPIVARARGQRDSRPPTSILLLSDGADTTETVHPVEAARRARRLGIRIYSVALGTRRGEVTVPDPATGFLRTIPVPPDRETLKEISKLTGGRAFEAKDAERLDEVYRSIGARIGARQVKREITAGFAGGGLVLLLVAGALSLIWFGRLP